MVILLKLYILHSHNFDPLYLFHDCQSDSSARLAVAPLLIGSLVILKSRAKHIIVEMLLPTA